MFTEIPYMFTDQPYMLTEIPYMFTDQPYMFTEIPYMFTDQPYMLTEIPYMFTDQPYMFTEIPYMFTDQPYMLTEIGVLPSIDSHSKHNIVHGKLNFKFPSPPPYKRKVWNYRAAKVDLIRDQLDNVNWNDLFHNLNVNEMCLLFAGVFFWRGGGYVYQYL